MNTHRSLTRVVAATLAATLLAACGEADLPTAATAAPSLQPQNLRIDSPSFDIDGVDVPLTQHGDTLVATFKVKPEKATTFVWDGKNAIKFPARAICEPETSSYGPGEWNKPCAPTAREIEVTLKSYYDAAGSLRVDFQPALRFNPWTFGVYLYLDAQKTTANRRGQAVDPWFKTIYYCPDVGACFDESLTDPTLRTFYDSRLRVLARRIKHFSGYNVGFGFAEAL